MFRAFRLPAIVVAAALCLPASPPRNSGTNVIIDTDAGGDDLLALAYLLGRPEIRIEAITVVHGLAHVESGARNVLRVLALAGRGDIPVFPGEERPLAGNSAFPEEWRRTSDQDPAPGLTAAAHPPETRSAVDYLAGVFRERSPRRRLLALGPHTNLALALRRSGRRPPALESITLMGGALAVPGNLGDGGVYRTENSVSEWNLYVDPEAARVVFSSGIPIVMVPLDATNRVPIDAEFVRTLDRGGGGALGRLVLGILSRERALIDQGYYFAWDPLAAVILAEPGVATLKPMYVEVTLKPPFEGRTRPVPGRKPNARVAVDADAARFHRLFAAALSPSPR